jgi:hypothetical protein
MYVSGNGCVARGRENSLPPTDQIIQLWQSKLSEGSVRLNPTNNLPCGPLQHLLFSLHR